MKSKLAFEKIWADYENKPPFYEMRITASSEIISSHIKCYYVAADLHDLKEKINHLVCDKILSFDWELGVRDAKSAPYLKLAVHIKDKLGHVAIRVSMDSNNFYAADSISCDFNLETELGVLEQFGKRLEKLLEKDGLCTIEL